ncbi:MAG: aspartyl protease [Microcystaceae cyanobacterium]
MIQGKFGQVDELYFEIELAATDGTLLAVDALFDTGFSEWLAMDQQDVAILNWTVIGEEVLRMAKGEALFEIYAGQVRFNNQDVAIPVYVGQGIPEILIGRQWLRTNKLVVDLPSAILTLG